MSRSANTTSPAWRISSASSVCICLPGTSSVLPSRSTTSRGPRTPNCTCRNVRRQRQFSAVSHGALMITSIQRGAASRHDLVVIGSGPGGQRAAVAAAKLGARVALVEREAALGGAWANTGTIPSKSMREAIVYLTGLDQRAVYGQSYRLKHDISI